MLEKTSSLVRDEMGAQEIELNRGLYRESDLDFEKEINQVIIYKKRRSS